jgi:hypothetical protein
MSAQNSDEKAPNRKSKTPDFSVRKQPKGLLAVQPYPFPAAEL